MSRTAYVIIFILFLVAGLLCIFGMGDNMRGSSGGMAGAFDMCNSVGGRMTSALGIGKSSVSSAFESPRTGSVCLAPTHKASVQLKIDGSQESTPAVPGLI